MSTEPAGRRLLRRAVGRLDALATPHGLDRYLELVAPTWSSTEVRGRVTAVRRDTPSTVTLTIRPNGRWQGFEAGQHTQLSVEIDGVRLTRCYSMASSAHRPDTFELTVKAHPQGTVSRHLVAEAAVGQVVGLTAARGTFTLPAARPAHLLLLSGGSGITPVLSMLRTLCDEGHTGTVTFAHWSLTEADLPYRSELAELAAAHPNLRLVRIFTDDPGSGDLDGFLSVDQLDAIDPAWRHAATYLCGPAPLMDSARAIFAEAGCADRLHTEAFTLTHLVAEAGSGGGTVRFCRSNGAERAVEVANDGRPLLEQAEAAGLAPQHGCRMGICHTCTRPLTAGTVRNVVDGEVTTATPDSPVAIRLCVNAPVGDSTVEL